MKKYVPILAVLIIGLSIAVIAYAQPTQKVNTASDPFTVNQLKSKAFYEAGGMDIFNYKSSDRSSEGKTFTVRRYYTDNIGNVGGLDQNEMCMIKVSYRDGFHFFLVPDSSLKNIEIPDLSRTPGATMEMVTYMTANGREYVESLKVIDFNDKRNT